MKLIIIVFALSFFSMACQNDSQRNNSETNSHVDTLTMKKMATDTTKTLIAQLPIFFDSTNYLIHPVGFIEMNNSNSGRSFESQSYSNESYSNNSFSISNSRQDYYSGTITNLVFENRTTRIFNLLAKNALLINNFQYLRNLSKKIKKDYILYSVIDNDGNQDGQFNYLDINSLYISNIDGTNFKKLTEPNQTLNDGILILDELKYYFRTIQDSNKDGYFNNKDKYRHYYIDFSFQDLRVVEYNPLELIGK